MPKIYVACLASYNAGKLHGEWIDAAQDEDTLREAVEEMLKKSTEPGAEEFAIHDYEGFEGIDLKEYDSLERVSKLALLLEEHGEPFAYFYKNDGSYYELDEVEEKFQESYAGEYSSKEDYAEKFLEETGQLNEIPESLRSYFDFASYARDLELGGDVHFSEPSYNKCYVFNRI